ncbi:BQ2448_1841 [Microbotryum intermedium]|uniref:BQ2448_1841 protein n=1 Tax=Microbotryum intermedium TaxID=269621 RepID=A0A238FBA8_9BASI|nr:BQ2448_1841 [Microbotryum intermedium]
MAVSSMAANLAQLIGLDEPTVAQQILPYMTSIKSTQEVRTYLESHLPACLRVQTLLPPGQASQALIQAYLAQRFPSAAASRPQPPSSSSSNAAKADPWGTGKPKTAARIPAAPSRKPAPAPNLEAMQSQFASTGKVYVKNRDDLDQGWGGLGVSSSSLSNSSSRALSRTTTPIQAMPAVAASSSINSPVQRHINGMSSSSTPASQSISLSETSRSQLTTLEASLKLLRLRASTTTTTSTKRSCFCSARTHPLSPYCPLCPSCGLILCSLNPPAFPCPSCQHPTLVSAPLLESYITSLESQRSDLLERERRRTQAEKEQEALERAAIRFPELGAASSTHPSQVQGSGRKGYADLVGGGRVGVLDLQRRLERGYAEGRTVSGREFGGGGGAMGPQKVLRLDMKTNKVKVQTKTKVVKKAVPSQGGPGQVEHVEEEEDEVDEWEGSRSIDESDDGWRVRNGLPPLNNATNVGARRDASRPFINLTLDEKDQPRWIEPTTIDSEPFPPTTGVEVDFESSGRRNVPGAAPSKALDGKKNKRNRRAKTEEGALSVAGT